jgi:hypothetical protein
MSLLPEVDERKRMQLLTLMDVSQVAILVEEADLGVGFMSNDGASRIRWLPCAHSVKDGDRALALVLQEDFDPDEIVILETETPMNQRECHPDSDAIFEIISDNTNRLAVDVKTSTSGWLLISDVWYPGWGVTIDGEEAEISRADYLFRAVAVPTGDHRVEFRYRPVSLYIGSFLSTCGWLAAIFLIRRQRRTN